LEKKPGQVNYWESSSDYDLAVADHDGYQGAMSRINGVYYLESQITFWSSIDY
jgi:hypothetical protein